MKSARVLILHPSTLHDPFWGYVYTIKPQLASLQTHLHRNGIEAKVVDLEVDLGRPQTKQEIEKFLTDARARLSEDPFDVLGISCYTSLQYLSTIEIANIAREIAPNAIIVVGGHHPMAVPADFLYSHSPFDYIVHGEGELAFLNICRDPQRRTTPQIIRGAQLPLVEETLPLWDLYPYRHPKSIIPTYLSRGCPFTCKFCMEPSRPFAGWRSLTVDDSLRDIQSVYKTFAPRQIKLCDAIFGFRKSWRREFLSKLAALNLDTTYWLTTRIDTIDAEDMDLYQKLKLSIAFGIETGSEDMVRIMGKAKSPRQYLRLCTEMVSELNAREIPYRLFLIFNHPGETMETVRESVAFFEALVDGQKSFSGLLMGRNYLFFPGNEIEEGIGNLREKYGTVITHPEWWKEPVDHHLVASLVSGSSDSPIDNHEKRPDFWMEDIARINRKIKSKMPIDVKLHFVMEDTIARDMLIRPPTQWWDQKPLPEVVL